MCEYTDPIPERVFSENDICLIGVPSYGGRVPRTAVERINGFKGNGASAILVVSYGNRDYDDTLIELFDVVNSGNLLLVVLLQLQNIPLCINLPPANLIWMT